MPKKKTSTHTLRHYVANCILSISHESIPILLGLMFLGIGYLLLQELKRMMFLGVLGIATIIMGIGLILNSLVSLYLPIFSFSFNKSICRFCNY